MNGVLNLNKPRGMTSHDCVFKLRKLLKTKKIGHTGTLDPEVDGVLPICVGRATKIVEYLTAERKGYAAEVTLGVATTTEDAYGEVVAEQNYEQPLTNEQVDELLARFVGELTQVPPMFSAVKVNGKRLYEYARQGLTVERPSRQVMIYEIERTSDVTVDENGHIKFRFRVICGKGTYIRTLAVQIGEQLGVPAHMSDLTRFQSGRFLVEESVTLEQVAAYIEANGVDGLLQPVDEALSELPKIVINDKVAEKVKVGSRFAASDFPTVETETLFVTEDGEVLAIYARHPEKPDLIKPVKVLYL